jgi:predicted Zn-dependent protease
LKCFGYDEKFKNNNYFTCRYLFVTFYNMKKIFILATLLTSIIFTSCATSPENAGISEEEINADAVKAYADVKTKSKISTNAEWTAIVQRVSKRIAMASGKNYQWEYILIESPEVNAWCMPGGKMAVYTGIMKVVKTEAALAAVMGHEVAHATLRHGMENYARAKQQNYLGAGLAVASGVIGAAVCETDNCRAATQVGGVLLGAGIQVFYTKFSRADESAADHEGQLYMARAGYDPAEAIQLWDRMNAASGGKAPPEFISTHPSDEHRKSNLSAWLPTANIEYQNSTQKFGIGAAIQ